MNIPAELINISGEAIMLSRGRKVIYANRAAEELMGGRNLKSIDDILHADILNTQADRFVAAFSKNGESYIMRTCTVDGIKAMAFSPVENELSALTASFFAEFNNTVMGLSVVNNMADELMNSMNYDELKTCMHSLNRNYYKLNRLSLNVQIANDVLQNKLNTSCREENLSKYIRSFVETVGSLYSGIEFSLSVPDEMFMSFDKKLMTCALTNIVSNSVVHSECTKIDITMTEVKNSAVISITDNGSGIELEKFNELFNTYKKSDFPNCGGAGLGLTVARGIVQAHGGTLILESRENCGTTVRISLENCVSEQGLSGMAVSDNSYVDIDSMMIGLSPSLPDEAFI